MKVLCLLTLSMLVLVLAYRIHLVLQRPLPPGLPEPEKIRWLDECGRIALAANSLMQYIGVNPGSDSLKILSNTLFALMFNPLPWQRPDPVTLTVIQDVYDGVPVSVYTPQKTASSSPTQPTIIYFHGGGWTWLSVGVYDGPLKHLANSTRHKVIAVEYRKAPRHVFPAAYEDCLAVTQYVVKNARQLGVRQDAIIVAGDGAGGNLAAAVALALRDKLTMQILINPALQALNFATPSYQDNARLLPGITSAEKEATNWLRYAGASPRLLPKLLTNQHVSHAHVTRLQPHLDSRKRLPRYLNLTTRHTAASRRAEVSVAKEMDVKVTDPRFCPMLTTDVTGVANAYVIASHYDVLRDEAVMYAHRLLDSKIKVKLKHYRHAFHGFFLFSGGGWITFTESVQAMDDLVDFLNLHIFNIT
ncbi:neutral cholesterol ester hydrolase 1-like [Littorina saxatilis]|uniref:Alpha/beta hydrolase fold-3 domain-containing protein n=1 Tax=Littorina saxatilis TaxID=31220 RepID=A0AAN9BYF9_9CAEN